MLDNYLERSLRKDMKVHCGKIDNILLQNTKEDLKSGKNILKWDIHNVIEMSNFPQ